MVLLQDPAPSAPSFSSGGGWGGGGRTGTELRCSSAEQPPQNLLGNCSISGCSLSPCSYILYSGVLQSQKMCASQLQKAKKGAKCLKCGVSEPSSQINLFFIQKVAPNGLCQRQRFPSNVCWSFLRFTKRADFCRNHTGTALHKPFEITSFISF